MQLAKWKLLYRYLLKLIKSTSGNFVNDQICGEGTFSWKNGDKYEGAQAMLAVLTSQATSAKMERSQVKESSHG